MANVNVNNNNGTINVADTMVNFNSHDDRQMEAWLEKYYPTMVHPAPVRKEPEKLEASSIEAKIDALTEQIALLTSILTAKEA